MEGSVVIIDFGLKPDHSICHLLTIEEIPFDWKEFRMVWFGDFPDWCHLQDDINFMHISNYGRQNKATH